jgi:hypothetical protein
MWRGHFEGIVPRFRLECNIKSDFKKMGLWRIGVESSGSEYMTSTNT